MRVSHSLHAGFAAAILVLSCLGSAAAAAPQRIASTNLCSDEYLFRLVPRSRIAALSILAADTNPQVSTIAGEVGGIRLVRPNAEAVLMQHPDLVLLYAGVDPRLASQLKEAAVPVVEIPWANTLAAIRRVTMMLGVRLGTQAKAAALLAQMDRKLAEARRMAPRPPVHTVLYEPNGYVAAGPLTSELMQAGGLDNDGPELTGTRTGAVPIEQVIADAPELLILDGGGQGALAEVPLHHPALAALGGRTRIVRAQLRTLLCAGPWSADAALMFARYGNLARTRLGQ